MNDQIEKNVDNSPSIIGSLLIIIIVHFVGLPFLLAFAFMLGFANSTVFGFIFLILSPIIFIMFIQFLSEKFLGGHWEFKTILYIEIILIIISIPFW